MFSDFVMRSPGYSDGNWSLATSNSPTNTNYSDPFVRGESPFEVGDVRFDEMTRLPSELKTQAGPAFDSQPMPYVPRHIRQRTRFNFCVFCKNNGEEER